MRYVPNRSMLKDFPEKKEIEHPERQFEDLLRKHRATGVTADSH